MNNRMKTDIANLKNAKIGKEIIKNTIGSMYLWMLIWFMNNAKKNFIGEEIALTIIVFALLCGCITAIVARRNKVIFILFKVISIWMISLGFLAESYTSYYVFLKFKSIIFLCVTLFMYVLIFISALIMIKNKSKQKKKIKREMVKQKILLCAVISFCLACVIIIPIKNKLSQFTIHVLSICLGTLLSYVLVAFSAYYFLEYMGAKKIEAKRKK